ncbi:hypothetical protein PQR39_25695 [Paraburkholderia sediminicola]|uniref:hypothetical protein n=1 Tax=Paraburkholderia sediminicola TaxID=458836 RepID=UPI0038B9E44D
MPIDDATLKTSLRLPKSLHAEIESAARSVGLTINAEMLVRLERNPRDNAAEAILAAIERRDTAVADGLRKQISVLWSAIDRADDVLKRVALAMSKVSGEGEGAALKRDVEFALQLINAVSASR